MSKGINENMRICTIPDLLARIDEEYEKREKEIKIRKAAQEEQLMAAYQEEKEIIKKIGEAQKIVEKMINEYQKIEADVRAGKQKDAERDALREADVRSGKTTLKEFMSKGKRDSEIERETMQKSVAELEQSLKIIREKNLEILNLNDSLGECRNRIRGLNIRPAKDKLDVFAHIKEFTEEQIGGFIAELESYRTEWRLTKERILWTQGKAFAPYFYWHELTQAQARAIIFDPVLPLDLVADLKREIDEFSDSETISLAFHLRTHEIVVTSIIGRRGLIQTGNLPENKDTKFKRKKIAMPDLKRPSFKSMLKSKKEEKKETKKEGESWKLVKKPKK